MRRQPIPVRIEKENEIHNFESMAECARFLGCQTGQIALHKTYKGWKITILGQRTKMKNLKCKVFMFHRTGEFIQEFESVHECARHFGVQAKNLVRYIQNGKFKEFRLSYSKENVDTFDINDFN